MITKTDIPKKIGIYIATFVIIFILIGHLYPDYIQSSLKSPLCTLPSITIDWWSITHFFYFGILAFLYPSYICELFIISIIWEIVEDSLAPNHNKFLIDCSKTYDNPLKESFKNLWCNHTSRENDYWYGKWDDVFFNSMGIIIGYGLRKMISDKF